LITWLSLAVVVVEGIQLTEQRLVVQAQVGLGPEQH
jgi:hypothetical protein